MEFYSYLSLFPLVVFLERCSSSVFLSVLGESI